MKKSENNNGKIISALLIGTAIGATLGILFAPHKGSKTRKKLLSKGKDAKSGVRKQLNELYENVSFEKNHLKDVDQLDHLENDSKK